MNRIKTCWVHRAGVTGRFPALMWGLLACLTSAGFVHGFGTGVATRPGKIVGINAKKVAVLPPGGGEDFVAISCGKDLYLALRYDGSIIAWGADRYGAVRNQPKGNNFIGIACGMDHCLAMRSDGSILVWGGCEKQSKAVVSGPEGNDFLDFCGGGWHSAVIRNDGKAPGQGSIHCWGVVKNPPPGNNFVSVKAGNKHLLALRADGTSVGWGSDNYRQSSSQQGIKDLIAVAGGGYRNLGLNADGSLRLFPPRSEMPAGQDFVAISAGYGCCDIFIRKDGSLVLRHSKKGRAAEPPPGKDFVAVAAGYYAGLAIQSPPGKPLPKPTVHVFAPVSVAYQGSDTPAEFVIHRGMATGPALTVKYTVGGSAVAGSDYEQLSGTVTIPAELQAAIVPVRVLKNAKLDGGKEVVLTLSSDDAYSVGSPKEARVKLDKGSVTVKKSYAPFLYRKLGPFAGPFAQEIKAARARAGQSQEAFAEKMKVDLATLQSWEAGRFVPLDHQAILKQADGLAEKNSRNK